MKHIGFFNNKGGVGKTTLVYHIAWMYAEMGYKVIAADLDPQANLTSMFLDDERLEKLWQADGEPGTIYGAIRPLLEGTGDVETPRVENVHVEDIADNLGLVTGDLRLSDFEEELGSSWPASLDGKTRAFRVLSALYRAVTRAGEAQEADVVLVDMGPNLGALNRAVLIGCEHVVVPLAPDLYSLQGLRNLGPTLRRWREGWRKRLDHVPSSDMHAWLPKGEIVPVGYVIMQHGVRLNRPVIAYQNWIERIPATYRKAVLAESPEGAPAIGDDPYCLALLKHYRSLMPLAMESNKPMFRLKPADGAIGAHMAAVQNCYRDFRELASRIAAASGLDARAEAPADSRDAHGPS